MRWTDLAALPIVPDIKEMNRFLFGSVHFPIFMAKLPLGRQSLVLPLIDFYSLYESVFCITKLTVTLMDLRIHANEREIEPCFFYW